MVLDPNTERLIEDAIKPLKKEIEDLKKEIQQIKNYYLYIELIKNKIQII